MIGETETENFNTLHRAFNDNHACLMECKRKSDGKIVNLICAVNIVDGEYEMIPFAEMIDATDESPFDQYYPPDSNSDNGFFEDDVYSNGFSQGDSICKLDRTSFGQGDPIEKLR